MWNTPKDTEASFPSKTKGNKPDQREVTILNTGTNPSFLDAQVFNEQDEMIGPISGKTSFRATVKEGERLHLKVKGDTIKTWTFEKNSEYKIAI
jgi:hypothetical protein